MDWAWRQGSAPMNPMLLQHTLRGLCSNESQWVYAVFWRILPRNYPPPQWDTEGGGIMDRSKGNKRNWIMVWEDGFCNFAACAATSDNRTSSNAFMSVRHQQKDEEPEEPSMNPELFFKMSHEVYNYGEGLMGKVAVDNSHKWVCREPLENDAGLLNSPWQNSIDPHPRTWEGQFKSGIQTIAVVAVQEGVLQLGSTQKMMEDLNFVIYVQRKFNFLHAIPGVLLSHPTTTTEPRKRGNPVENSFPFFTRGSINDFLPTSTAPITGTKRPPESDITLSLKEYYYNNNPNSFTYEQCPSPPKALYQNPTTLLPSMSSLQALLSKLPSVTVPCSYPSDGRFLCPPICHSSDMHRIDQEEEEDEEAALANGKEKPRYSSNHGSSNSHSQSSMFDSFDNFTELGLQEALENGDSSYTSFLNEICS